MPAPSDRPLQKVHVNFFRDNIDYLTSKYGPGWTQEIRRVVDEYVTKRKQAQQAINEALNEQ